MTLIKRLEEPEKDITTSQKEQIAHTKEEIGKATTTEEETKNTHPTPETTANTSQGKGDQPTTTNTKEENTTNNNNTTKNTTTTTNGTQEDTLAQDIQEHMEAAHNNRKDTNTTWEDENKAEIELNKKEDWHDY